MSLDIRFLTNGEKEVFTVRDSSQSPPSFNIYEKREQIPKSIRHYADSKLKPTFCKPDSARVFGVLDLFYPDHGSCRLGGAKNSKCLAESCAAVDSAEWRRIQGLNKPARCWTECPHYIPKESEKTMKVATILRGFQVGDNLTINRTLDNKVGQTEGTIIQIIKDDILPSFYVAWEHPDDKTKFGYVSGKTLAKHLIIHQTHCCQCGKWLTSTSYKHVKMPNKSTAIKVEDSANSKSQVGNSRMCFDCLQENVRLLNSTGLYRFVDLQSDKSSGELSLMELGNLLRANKLVLTESEQKIHFKPFAYPDAPDSIVRNLVQAVNNYCKQNADIESEKYQERLHPPTNDIKEDVKEVPKGRKRSLVSGTQANSFMPIRKGMRIRRRNTTFMVLEVTPLKTTIEVLDEYDYGVKKASTVPNSLICQYYTTLDGRKLRYETTVKCNHCGDTIWLKDAVEYYTKLWRCKGCDEKQKSDTQHTDSVPMTLVLVENRERFVLPNAYSDDKSDHISIPVKELDEYEDIRLAGGELFLAALASVKEMKAGAARTRLGKTLDKYGKITIGEGVTIEGE